MTGVRAARPRVAVARPVPVWPAPVPVRQWMHAPVVTVSPGTLVSRAAGMMRRHKVRHLAVVDARRQVVGIVTERDLRQAVFNAVVEERLGPAVRALTGLCVRDVMTWAVLTVRPDTDVRDAARIMRAQGRGGSIINTASIAGLSGDAGPLAYSAAKAAVINLSRAMVLELAQAIRINCVCPGNVDTDMIQEAAQATGDAERYLAAAHARSPMKRMARFSSFSSSPPYR